VKLKEGFIAANVYDPFFVPKRLKVVRSHIHLFENLPGFDLGRVESSPGAFEFDKAAVVPATQEFDTVEDFYRARSSCFVLDQIETPGLFINARDDPFTNIDTMKPDVIRANENLIAVVTERGGHLGFVGK
jgi:predicted alpha/beta-fold hydrolase